MGRRVPLFLLVSKFTGFARNSVERPLGGHLKLFNGAFQIQEKCQLLGREVLKFTRKKSKKVNTSKFSKAFGEFKITRVKM